MEGEATILRRSGQLIEGIESIGDGPEATIAVVDKTPMASRHKRKRASRCADSGNISCSAYWDPSDPVHQAIYASRDDSPTVPWELEYLDGTKHEFQGFATAVKITGLESETEAMLEFSVEIDGDITETPAP